MRKYLYLILVIAIPVMARAQVMQIGVVNTNPSLISADGTANAAATSTTFTATATGDLKILMVTRAAAGCATVPAGWTTVGSCTNAASAGAFSTIVACNVSSSSADTGTGTWTNASRMVGASYSGTTVGTTGNCNTTGIGTISAQTAAASTSVNWATIALTVGTGRSRVAGFGGDINQAITCPTALPQRVASATAVRACDSNAGFVSWAGATTSVTSSTWITTMLEILSA